MHQASLDPRPGLFEGRQHPPQGHETFGVFADASPDRWGRLLAWELLVQTLAKGCGLRVPPSLARRFASKQHR